MRSFFLVDRAVYDHPLFNKEPYSKRDAWIWLCSEACFQKTKKLINGRVVELERGQLSHSIRFLASKWLWNKAVVERFLGRLKTETMIETGNGTGQIVITICNYDEYQTWKSESETGNETAKETRRGHDEDTTRTKKKEYKELKERYTPLPPDGELRKVFETQFAAIYPKKRFGNREKAFIAFKAACTRDSQQTIIDGAAAYADSDEATKENGKYAKGAAAWLNDDRWRGYSDGPAAPLDEPGISEAQRVQRTLQAAGLL